MPGIVQFRRAATAVRIATVLQEGELYEDTTTKKFFSGDGSTVGGIQVDGTRHNNQTGTSYTVLDSDVGKIVTFSNVSPVAVSLGQAGGASGTFFPFSTFFDALNLGSADVTITPTTSVINGLSSLVLKPGQGARLASNGENYLAIVGAAGSGLSSFTLGSTAVALGSTVTTIDGLTLNSPTLSGTVAGTYNIGGTPTLTVALGLPGSGQISSAGELALGALAPVSLGSSIGATLSFDGTGYTLLADQANTGSLRKSAASGLAAVINLDPIPADGTSSSSFQFMRVTNTSGAARLNVFAADGTATASARISANSAGGASFVNANHSGNFGIGLSNPQVRLHVSGSSVSLRVDNSFTNASNGEWGLFGWSSNEFFVGTDKNGTSTARNLKLQTGGTVGFAMHATSQLIALGPSAAFTASFPALKRSTTTLQVRLGDDSAFGTVQGKLQTDANAATETITPDKTLTLYDAAGTAYKVPCVAA